jgi:chaperonin GroES
MAKTATATKLRPLSDRVLVEPAEHEERTKSGIVIPDTAKEKPQEGMVRAVGPVRRLESGELVPMDVKQGQKVLYAKWSGTEVKIDDKPFLVLSEKDILATID